MSDKEKEDIDKDDEFTDSYIEFYIYANTVFIIVYIGLLIYLLYDKGNTQWFKTKIFALTCILATILFVLYYIIIKPNTRITKYIEKAIHIYFNDYEDITLLTFASLLSLALYKIMDSFNKAHEKFILYMTLIVFSIIKCILLYFRLNNIEDYIRNYNIVGNYKCEDGEPTTTAPPVVCDNDSPKLNKEFIENDDDAYTIDIFGFKNVKLNTLFYVKLVHYILLIISIILILIAIIEFFMTLRGTTCGKSDTPVGAPSDNMQKRLGFIEYFINYLRNIGSSKPPNQSIELESL